MPSKPNVSVRQSLPDTLGDASGGPRAWVAAVVIVLAIGAVYGRALDAPLIFDDELSIFANESIFSLWPLVGTAEHPGPLRPSVGRPTSGRPLVNLSFALNYAVGGLAPTGYHVVNVAIHCGCALLLWVIVRRTLRLAYFANRFDRTAGWLALAVALLWALHPLQTETVIYVTQRTELLMAFCYLATLYCSMRYWFAGAYRTQRAAWLTLAVVACLAGMASKEVMVSAPLMVLLYERTFVAGSLASVLRRSWPLYVGLAATWLLLLALNIGAPRGDTAGFTETQLVAWWMTQAQVLMMYLKLVVWPSPLLIHYILPEVESFADAWMYVVPILLLGIATLVLLWRNKPVGYLLCWIFAILSATSVVPIYTETAAERRMYLPLAAIAALFVIGVWRLVLFLQPSASEKEQGRGVLTYLVVPILLLAIVFGFVSAKRLGAYYDTFQLWQDVVRSQPVNYIANLNMGVELRRLGREPEAIEYFRKVVSLRPKYAEAHSNLGHTLVRVGRYPEGIAETQVALKLNPDNPYFLNNLGLALIQSGRSSDAIEHLERSVRLKPNYAQARNTFGLALANIGKPAEAIEQFGIALSIDPNYANAHCNLANVLANKGDLENAIAHYKSAVQIRPEFVEAHYKVAVALTQTGHPDQAIEHYQTAMQLQPKNLQIYASLAQTLAGMQRSGEAIATAQQGIEIARATNNQDVLNQFEGWLKNYHAKLGASGTEGISQPPTTDAKPNQP